MITEEKRVGQEKISEKLPSPQTYYRYPVIKEPEWGWQIFAYFFTGGLAAGAYMVATLADLLGSKQDRAVSRAGRWVAMASVAVSPILLIADLGRPERFANMLRIFKSRSPMNLGTWGLSGLAAFCGLGIIRQFTEDGVISRKSIAAQMLGWIPLPVTGVLGTIFAFFVGSYTGVLLSFTNVPLWAKNYLLQGPLFLTSALSTGLAAISTVLALQGSTPPKTQRWLEQAENAATIGEIGLIAGTMRGLGPLARPYNRQPYAMPFWLGTVGLGLILPLIFRQTTHGRSQGVARTGQVAAGLCVLAGGLLLRAVTSMAGQKSARIPEEYFRYTNDGNAGPG